MAKKNEVKAVVSHSFYVRHQGVKHDFKAGAEVTIPEELRDHPALERAAKAGHISPVSGNQIVSEKANEEAGKTVKAAKEEAKRILAEAKEEADKIIATATEEAKAIKENAEAEALNIMQAAEDKAKAGKK